MNQVILMGRLTKDPEYREYESAKGTFGVAKYTLAVNEGSGQYRHTEYIPCEAFGRAAEFAKNYLWKGRMILVVGAWHADKYTNKDGKTVHTHVVKVDRHEFTGDKSSDRPAGAGGQGAAGNEVRDDDFFTKLAQSADEFIQVPDDVGDEGLPFN